MFNLLRANDLIWSFVVNNYLLGKEPQPFDLLYWNDDGTRMTRVAHSYYLRNTYVENNVVKPDALEMKGVPIDLKRIKQDIYAVGTELDHLVPWRSAWRITQLTSGDVRFAVGGSGHIAGVINPPSKGRGYLINESGRPVLTADEWLEGAERRKGSWWTDWLAWLKTRSGKQVAPPPLGGVKYPPITPAPGTYVLEK
jgi:polyhydroxyalkanoate synthase